MTKDDGTRRSAPPSAADLAKALGTTSTDELAKSLRTTSVTPSAADLAKALGTTSTDELAKSLRTASVTPSAADLAKALGTTSSYEFAKGLRSTTILPSSAELAKALMRTPNDDIIFRALTTSLNSASISNVSTGPFSFTGLSTGTAASPVVPSSFAFPTVDDSLLRQHRGLQTETERLRREVVDAIRALKAEKDTGEIRQKRIEELSEKVREFSLKGNLGFVLDRVNPEAQRKLLRSVAFQKIFLETKQCQAFVMSVDIRRSTELMLKARSPEGFAQFITGLCTQLMGVIVDSYGVIDKFTGDGILAFYPDFFSEPDAAYRVLSTADRCHDIFARHYRESRGLFNAVLKDVGLGIGIDYGSVHLVQMAGGLTVVGEPVVYACRFSGAPAGTTLLNQPARDQIGQNQQINIVEKDIPIKHEGLVVAYEARLNDRTQTPARPTWFDLPEGDAS